MTPIEQAAQMLAIHRLSDIDGTCLGCEWNYEDVLDIEGDPSLDELHAAHVAQVLADAGLIPTQQEWGVEDEYSVIGFGGSEHSARTWAKGGTSPVVSRWTGATEWKEAEGTK